MVRDSTLGEVCYTIDEECEKPEAAAATTEEEEEREAENSTPEVKERGNGDYLKPMGNSRVGNFFEDSYNYSFDEDACGMTDENLAKLLEHHLSVWYENSDENLYETAVNDVLEKESDIHGENYDSEGIEKQCTSKAVPDSEFTCGFDLDFRPRRKRYNSDSSKQGSDCCSSGYRNSGSTSASHGEKHRRPSYSCNTFQHRRHYAVRRKGPSHAR